MSTSTTSTSVKVTNVSALQYVLDHCEMPTEISEKVTNILNSYVKKSEYKPEKKETAKQVANKGIYADIKTVLAEGGQMTIGAIVKALGDEELTGQRVSAIIRPFLNTEIVRTEVKGKAYFSLAE